MFKIGDQVIIRPEYAKPRDKGVVFYVDKVHKVNIDVTSEDGTRRLRGRPELFMLASEGAENSKPVAQVEKVSFYSPLYVGQVVKISGPGWKEPEDQLWVVISNSASNADRWGVAKLGGDGGRYFRVPRSFITVVNH